MNMIKNIRIVERKSPSIDTKHSLEDYGEQNELFSFSKRHVLREKSSAA